MTLCWKVLIICGMRDISDLRLVHGGILNRDAPHPVPAYTQTYNPTINKAHTNPVWYLKRKKLTRCRLSAFCVCLILLFWAAMRFFSRRITFLASSEELWGDADVGWTVVWTMGWHKHLLGSAQGRATAESLPWGRSHPVSCPSNPSLGIVITNPNSNMPSQFHMKEPADEHPGVR